KLQLCSVFCFRSWVDADVRFGDVACVGIEEDACAPSHLTGVEGFVLRSRRDRQQVDAIARVGRTDRSKRRPRDDKIYVRKTGPASKRAAHGTDDVAIGFDVRTGSEQRVRQRNLDRLFGPAYFADGLCGRLELERITHLQPLSGTER